MHHDGGLVATLSQHRVEFLLVGHTAGAVIHHHLAFQSCRTDILSVVLDDMVADLVDAFGRGEEGLHLSALRQLVFLVFRQLVLCGHLVESLLQTLLVEVHLHRHLAEVQLQRGAVVNRVLKGVLRHIAALVLVGTKAFEGILVAFVDGGAGQSEEESIGQRSTHTFSQVFLLRAVRLVNQHDNVLADIQRLLHLSKKEDGSDENLTLVGGEEVAQLFAGVGEVNVLYFRAGEVARYLVAQVDAVVHNSHRWGVQFGHLHQLLCGENHQPRFARPLEVPYQTFLGTQPALRSRHHAVHDSHSAIVLLIAADDLNLFR